MVVVVENNSIMVAVMVVLVEYNRIVVAMVVQYNRIVVVVMVVEYLEGVIFLLRSHPLQILFFSVLFCTDDTLCMLNIS